MQTQPFDEESSYVVIPQIIRLSNDVYWFQPFPTKTLHAATTEVKKAIELKEPGAHNVRISIIDIKTNYTIGLVLMSLPIPSKGTEARFTNQTEYE